MPCEINELDTRKPELARALEDLGGYFYEAGLRKYDDWKAEVRREIGGRVSEAALQSAWLSVKIEAAGNSPSKRTAPPTPTTFVEEIAKKLGKENAANLLDTLAAKTNGEPEILQKLIAGEPLTDAEKRDFTEAWRANQPKRSGPQRTPPMQEVANILLESRPIAQARKKTAGKPKPVQDAAAVEARKADVEERQRARKARQEDAKRQREEVRAAERFAMGQVRQDKQNQARGDRARQRVQDVRQEARNRAEGILGNLGKPSKAKFSQSMVDVATAEYAKGARSINALARSLEEKTGQALPEGAKEAIFKAAAEAYRNDPSQATAQRIKEKMRADFDAEIRKTQPFLMRRLHGVARWRAFWQTFKASLDLSYLGRQGGKIAAVRPDIAIRAAIKNAPAWLANNRVAITNAQNAEIEATIDAYGGEDRWKDIGLKLTVEGEEEGLESVGKFEGAAKAFQDRIGITGSEAANRLILNQMRLDYFRSLAKPSDPVEYQKAMATLVNIFASRADTQFGNPLAKDPAKRKADISDALTIAHDYLNVWSPRNWLSNVQFLSGRQWTKPLLETQTLSKSDPQYKTKNAALLRAARVGVGNTLQYYAVVGTLLTLVKGIAAAGGWEDWLQAETNPRSGDFGKIRAGRLELDMTAGARRHWVALMEMMGKRGASAFDGEDGKAVNRPKDRLIREYLRGTLRPDSGELVTWFLGKDFKGDAVPVTGYQDDPQGERRFFVDEKEALKRTGIALLNLNIADWVEVAVNEGMTPEKAKWLAAATVFNFIGIGAQVRERGEKAQALRDDYADKVEQKRPYFQGLAKEWELIN